MSNESRANWDACEMKLFVLQLSEPFCRNCPLNSELFVRLTMKKFSFSGGWGGGDLQWYIKLFKVSDIDPSTVHN